MKAKLFSALLVLFGVSASVSFAAEPVNPSLSVKLPAKEKLHLYLLLGQSNMAGRGVVEAEDKTPHPRVLTFTKEAQWELAIEPITHDKLAIMGVGPGLAFGKAMAEATPEITVGLIPCAVGGTPLKRWERGGDLYSNAVYRARLAMKAGTLQGVIWHQGESDSKPNTAPQYGKRLAQVVRDLRADLETPDLIFVAGQIGDFIYTRTTNNIPEAKIVNAGIAQLPELLLATGFVPVEGLTHKGDQLHFDTASERELGRRYARETLRLQKARTN